MAKQVRALIGLGSNLGDREAHLRFALRSMGQSSLMSLEAVSRVYETDAVGPGEQGPYLNATVAAICDGSAEALLAELLAIEIKAGRDRAEDVERWAARTLDLDLLFFGDDCIEQPGPSIPHPRLHQRAFVLEPLCDLAPEFVHPGCGVTLAELARKLREKTAIRVWPTALEIPR